MSTLPKGAAEGPENMSLDDLHEQMLQSDPEFRRLWEASAAKRAIAIALVRMRKQAGRTQSEVAERAKWDKAFVSRLEGAGGAVPDTLTLMRYAAACDRAVGLVFAFVEADQAHVIDAVTLAAPSAAHPFERLRGDNLALQDEPIATTGSYLTR
jgi:transcriptional regulator with XRE-family HTH domain